MKESVPKIFEIDELRRAVELDRLRPILTVERRWQCGGLDCIAIAHSLGHRCGYVRVPERNPLFKCDDYDADLMRSLDVHGGVTFSERVSQEEVLHPMGPGYWIGFDCFHGFDAPDPEIQGEVDKIFSRQRDEFYNKIALICDDLRDKKIWKLSDVIEETENLARQVLEIGATEV